MVLFLKVATRKTCKAIPCTKPLVQRPVVKQPFRIVNIFCAFQILPAVNNGLSNENPIIMRMT